MRSTRNRHMIAAVLSWLAFALWAPQVHAISTGSLKTGLVAYWKLNEASNTSRLDSSGNGNTLTDHGSNVATTASGQLGSGLSLAASTSAYLEVADTNLPHGDSDLTISTWIWLNSGNAGTYAVVAKNGFSPNLGWIMQYNAGTGRLAWIASMNGTSAATVCPSFDGATISADAWHHYVVWYRASDDTMGLYIDNVSRGSCAPGGSFFDQRTNYTVGGSPLSATPRMWPGKIDEVAIWSRVLSASEVAALYNAKNGVTYPFGPPAMLFGGGH